MNSALKLSLLLPCLLLASSITAQPMAIPSGASAGAPAKQAPAKDPQRGADEPENPHGAVNPHGAANPHGGGRPQQQGYTPPEDGGKVDPSLPKGTIALYLGDAFDQPVDGAEVELLIVHESVAQGKSQETKVGTTNAEGEVTFAGLAYGSGHSYALRSIRGPASFEVGPMGLTDKGGVRAFLHVFDSTSNIEQAGILGRTEVQLSFKEDVIVVNCSVTYVNRSPYAWVAEREITLPAGFKALTTPDGMSPSLVPTETGAILRGTLPPGEVELGFRYHLPLEKDGKQDLRLPFLPNIVQVAVGMEASKSMELSGKGFDPPKRSPDPTGKSWLVTYRNAKDRNDHIPYAELAITGLPTRAIGSWVALGLALAAAGIAAAYVVSRRHQVALPADTMADLEDAKQALLKEFVSLERARKQGEIGPKTYDRIRRAMLDALARIMSELETGSGKVPSTGINLGDGNVEAVLADRKKPGR
jgi:hypothetical protein